MSTALAAGIAAPAAEPGRYIRHRPETTLLYRIVQRYYPRATANTEERTFAEQHAAMTWAQRLKRVFNIDVATCDHCGGAARVIACIEDPDVIDKILTHLNLKHDDDGWVFPDQRAPPGLFDDATPLFN